MVKLEAFVQDLLDVSCLLLSHVILVVGLHLKLNVKVAVGLVRQDDAEGLAEADGYGSEVEQLRCDSDLTVVAGADDLNRLFDLKNTLVQRAPLSLVHTASWVEESDLMLQVVKLVLSYKGHRDLVVLLFQSRESRMNLLNLVGHQACFYRLEVDFVDVLLGDAPLKLKRDA